MSPIDLLTHVVTSILIGYLALTNSLATSIQSYLDKLNGPETVEEMSLEKTPLETSDESLLSLSETKSALNTLPRILRDNADFQRAALSASLLGSEKSTVESKPIREAIRESLVNIYCQLRTADYIRTTTGSGFFIHENGVILTNAHVAQFLLLNDVDKNVVDTKCVIRVGEPATPRYEAELLYISPSWIFQNAKLLREETPSGTGERDYALLYVARSLDGSALPSRFPTLTIDTDLLPRSLRGSEVLTAGYPAEALFREGSKAKLIPVLATTTVTELYTFGSNYADIFSVSESLVGAQGASGGPIANNVQRIIGLIVTKGDTVLEGPRSLRAVTLSYIDRTITDETGFSLEENMRGDLAFRGNIFKRALIPFLSQLLLMQFE